MGAAQARLFAKEGANVVVADFREAAAREIAAEIDGSGRTALPCGLDVTSSGDWASAVETAERDFGKLDVMTYVAGSNRRESFDEQTEETFRWIMDANLTGAFLGIKACVPAMRRGGGGSIILVGSLASARAGGGSPAYAASKHGVIGLMKGAARAYAADGIRVNTVSPGHVDTPFIRANQAHSPNDERTSLDNPEVFQRRLTGTPIGRLCTPEDIAKGFLFLGSDDASMITGDNLFVDGGAIL